MSTLEKRAIPPQALMLRIVAGAVMNAVHAHPVGGVDILFARSVAKRAVGTLTASWPEVLAATKAGALAARQRSLARSRKPRRKAGVTSRRQGGQLVDRQGGGGVTVTNRRPLSRLFKEVSRRIGPAKRAGKDERAETLIELARIIDKLLHPEHIHAEEGHPNG